MIHSQKGNAQIAETPAVRWGRCKIKQLTLNAHMLTNQSWSWHANHGKCTSLAGKDHPRHLQPSWWQATHLPSGLWIQTHPGNSGNHRVWPLMSIILFPTKMAVWIYDKVCIYIYIYIYIWYMPYFQTNAPDPTWIIDASTKTQHGVLSVAARRRWTACLSGTTASEANPCTSVPTSNEARTVWMDVHISYISYTYTVHW